MNFSVLTIAGPPLIGAFIGYLTNRIAIRMLFRPLKPWYIFGLRVPMTPGVIPSKRHDLAVNIGEMVGNHLLTASDIGSAISEEPFQENLFSLVDARIDGTLTRDLGSVRSLVPAKFTPYFEVALSTLKYRMGGGLQNFLAQDEFQQTLTRNIERQLESVAEYELNVLFSVEEREAMYSFLEQFIAELLENKVTRDWVSESLQQYIQSAKEKNGRLNEYLPEECIRLVRQSIEDQAPQIVGRLAGLLSKETVRAKIIAGIIGGVDHFIESLGPMGAMARGFIDMDTLGEKIEEYLGGKEEDVAAWLQQDDVQQHFTNALLSQVESFFTTPVAALLENTTPEQIEEICNAIAAELLAQVRMQEGGKTFATILAGHLEEMFDQGRCSLGELATRFLSGQDGTRCKEKLIEEIVSFVRSEQTLHQLHAIISTMVDSLVAKPVGILKNILPAGIRQGVTEYLVLSTNKMLLKEVPGLVKSLQLKRQVTEKVDSLDLLKLEALLLSIMEEQFKYINLFGALLGFLIGLINLALLQFV